MRFYSIIIISLTILPISLAISSDNLDPHVYQVQSGSICSQQEKQGHIRVVIKNRGFEHILSTVVVECISDSTRESPPEVLFHHVLEDSGYFIVRIDRLEFLNGATEVSLEGIASHSGQHTNCLYRISKEGHLQVITSCAEGVDINGT